MSGPRPIPVPTLAPILAPELALPGIAHGYFTREGGVSRGLYDSLNGGIGSSDAPADIAENRARMARHLGVRPEAYLSVWQHHSPDCLVVETPFDMASRPKADAMATRTRGIGLAIGTADCGPVLFADAEAGVIGGAHSGWKGALTGVLEATIAAMESLGAERGRIVAVLGPMISRRAYEVGPEFVARFAEAETGNGRYFTPSPRADHAMFDLPAYIIDRLGRAGVGKAINLDICTYGDGRLYSYRRMTHRGEADYGRQLSAIALV